MSRRGDYRPPPPRDDYRQERPPYDHREYERYEDDRGDYRRDVRPYHDYDRPDSVHGHWERDPGWDDGRGAKRARYDDYDSPHQFRGHRDEYARRGPPQGYDPDYMAPHDRYLPPEHGYDTPPPHAQHSAFGAAAPPARPIQPPIQETPSASVVLLGLPVHVDDAMLRDFLESMGASIDSTTVIMDRSTGQSKRYGFAKFSSVEHARAFVEPNFPSIPWKERHGASEDDGLRIKINYSQKTGGWREDQGANSRMTDDQRKVREQVAVPLSFYVNDGTRDIGSAPTQTLLLRGLDPLTTEEEIVSALRQLGGRAGELIRQGGIRQVLLARDRSSRTSWGFAFVRFSDVRLATDVLGNAFNARFYPTGFRIKNAPVAFSFCHENAFIPKYAKSEWSFAGEGGQQLAYWDDKAFVSVWTPPVTNAAGSAPKNNDDPDADMEAFLSSLDVEGSGDKADDAQNATSGKAASAISAGPSGVNIKVSIGPGAAALAAASTPATGQKGKANPTRGSAPGAVGSAAANDGKNKKASELIYSRKQAGNINKWNQKQVELKQPEDPVAPSAMSKSSANSTPIRNPSNPQQQQRMAPVTMAAPGTGTPEQSETDEFEHGDPISFICLLCQRQFKAVDELRKHNKLSNLHKTNLGNDKAVADCAVRKAASVAKHAAAAATAAGSGSSDADAAGSTSPKYVDRAAARREAFAQPEHPVGDKKRKFEGPPPREPAAPARPANQAIEESNVGSKMLEKMGWSKGVGLGASGGGIAEPIQAAQFAQGAGLGATKGVVVGSQDPGPRGYAESLRDKARMRYEADDKK